MVGRVMALDSDLRLLRRFPIDILLRWRSLDKRRRREEEEEEVAAYLVNSPFDT